MVKIKNYILITIVAFFFVLLVLAVFLKPDGMYSVTERRSLKQQPEFSLENVLNGKFMSNFEEYDVYDKNQG